MRPEEIVVSLHVADVRRNLIRYINDNIVLRGTEVGPSSKLLGVLPIDVVEFNDRLMDLRHFVSREYDIPEDALTADYHRGVFRDMTIEEATHYVIRRAEEASEVRGGLL